LRVIRGDIQQYLTFIVPASRGCNLRCPFCIVRHRKEAEETLLRPEDFVRFIAEALIDKDTYALSLQGYEPLLPESMHYSEAILQTGADFGVSTILVTNGVYLGDAFERLIELDVDTVDVSLDSNIAEIHDRIRGVSGTWQATVDSLRKAISHGEQGPVLAVQSVLLPSKVENLVGMPRFLAELGIKWWTVNPVLKIGERRGQRSLERDIEILRACFLLQAEAEKCGIHFSCDDEFGCIDQARAAEIYPELAEVAVRRIEDSIELFRLTPSGQCSVGRDILSPITPDVPRWIPNAVHAGDFLASLPRPPPVVHDVDRDPRQGQHAFASEAEAPADCAA
jgi:MoaA/NifB/PqqE/SkfB family radical SAM enzyme